MDRWRWSWVWGAIVEQSCDSSDSTLSETLARPLSLSLPSSPVIVGMKSSFVELPPFHFPCRSAF